jgi:hypothetical protein
VIVDEIGQIDTGAAGDPLTPPPTATVAGRGAITGAAGGAIVAVAAGLFYVIPNRDLVDVPWASLAPTWCAYTIVSGALVAGGAAAGVGLMDSLQGARFWASPFPAATLGGALGLAIPGVVGATYFGAMSLPFMGGIGVFAIPVLGAVVVAIALAVQDRVQSGRSAAIGLTTTIAVVAAAILGALIAVGASRIGDEQMLDGLRSASSFFSPVHGAPTEQRTGLALLGALLGLGLGATLGAYVGAVMCVARRLR